MEMEQKQKQPAPEPEKKRRKIKGKTPSEPTSPSSKQERECVCVCGCARCARACGCVRARACARERAPADPQTRGGQDGAAAGSSGSGIIASSGAAAVKPGSGDPSSVVAAADAILWGKDLTLHARFGPLEGLLMIKEMKKHYAGDTKLTIPWFYIDADGNKRRTIVPHPLNRDSMDDMVETFAQGIATDGICPELRGEAWMQWDPALVDGHGTGQTSEFPVWSMSWGNLTAAAYIAFQRWPTNKYVMECLKDGVPACFWHSKMPEVGQVYLINYHNKWHKGNGITFREKMVATPKMIDEWHLINTTCSADPTYAAKWWGWVKKHAEYKLKFTSEDWGRGVGNWP
eukprot:1789865-Pyramimonas_sp.AAC.1